MSSARLSGHFSARRHRSGITLLEILIVLVILGLLATLGTRQVMSYLGRAKSDTAALQIKEIEAAIDLFRLDVGRVPATNEGLSALVAAPPAAANWRGPYLTKRALLNDPWGNAWIYTAKDARGYDLKSLGGDGAVGGTGEDQDMSNEAI
jgi:general secretion pathway protein G